jgi:hypothetical protein
MEIAVVRDLLDKQLVDRDGEPLGRVDGIVMSYSSDAALTARQLAVPHRGKPHHPARPRHQDRHRWPALRRA